MEMPTSSAAWGLLGDRPRWVSACIALAVCITASGSGAFLVRTLKMHRQPLALTTSSASDQNQPLPGAALPNSVAPPAAAASAPLVVDLQSLSVEPSAPRRPVRPISPPVPKPTATAEASEPSVENTDPIDDEVSPPPQNKPKTGDLPGAAKTNPYLPSSGSDDASAAQ